MKEEKLNPIGDPGMQVKLVSSLVFMLFFLMTAAVVADEAANKEIPQTVQDYGWCVLTCPKTCSEGKEFEIKLNLKHLKDISRNWEANKLAVHLFWSSEEKWGGYLGHFKSVGVSKDGEITLKGKFQLNDKIKSNAGYVHVKAVLTSDWANQDENKAADFMGPKIKILK